MAENVRTREQLEDVFREAACLILGIPEDDNKKIRFGWGSSPNTGSAPSFARNSDTVVIYFLTTDSPNNQTKDLSYIDEGNEKLTYVDEHTDVHQVQYVCYGPSAFEQARAIRDGMSQEDVRSLFRRNSLFFVTPVPAPVPVPDVFEGEWWNRYDVRVNFNEGVRIEKKNAVGYVEQVPLTASSADKKGPQKKNTGKDGGNG